MRHIGPLRVPIMVAAILIYLPLAGIVPAVPGSSLIRGLFDLRALTPDGDKWWIAGTFLTFFFAWLAVAVAIVATYQCAAMIHDLAPARFGTPAGRQWLGLNSRASWVLVRLPAVLAGVASLLASLDGRHPRYRNVLIVAVLAASAVLGALKAVIWAFGSKQPHESRLYVWARKYASSR